jgi:hypothetical protein
MFKHIHTVYNAICAITHFPPLYYDLFLLLCMTRPRRHIFTHVYDGTGATRRQGLAGVASLPQLPRPTHLHHRCPLTRQLHG